MLTTAALLALAALAAWRFGSVVLRWGGVFVVLGTVAWLVGHWLFAVRHHFYRSPLARRVFLQVLPARLDPTRRWGNRIIP